MFAHVCFHYGLFNETFAAVVVIGIAKSYRTGKDALARTENRRLPPIGTTVNGDRLGDRRHRRVTFF